MDKIYTVSVEKRMYATGAWKVKAATPEAAEELVEERINSGDLQTTDIEWDEPVYEDTTFQTTGDVEISEEQDG